MALYAGLLGSLTLIFQDAGSFLFNYDIRDPMITRYWGGVLLAMSIFYLFLSMDPQKYRLFLWIGVFDMGLASSITILSIATSSMNPIQGITGLILNPVFIIILLYGLAKKSEGEVVFVLDDKNKGAGSELPAHLSGKHPLHGK